jgi:hypothetical protein
MFVAYVVRGGGARYMSAGHKLSEGHRKRGAARNAVEKTRGVDGTALLGRTGHIERTSWLAGV